MQCPKCGHTQEQSDECSNCGIIISKFINRKAGPSSSTAPPPLSQKKKKFSLFLAKDQELRSYYHSLYQMLSAGFVPLDAHRHFMKHTPGFITQKPYRKIEEVLRQGNPASQGMLEFPDYFPVYHSMLIRVGEATGRPDMFYKELYGILDRKIQLKYSTIKNFAYPAFVVFASIFIRPLPILVSQGLMPYLQQSLFPLALAILSLFALKKIYQLFLVPKGSRRVIDKLKLSIPLYKTFYMNQYVRAFWSMNQAGINILETYHLSASAVDNLYFREKVLEQKSVLLHGRSVRDAFRESTLFPDDFIQFLSSGEQSGRLDFSMQKYLEISEENFRHQVSIASKILMILVLFFLFAFVASGVFSSFTSLLPK